MKRDCGTADQSRTSSSSGRGVEFRDGCDGLDAAERGRLAELEADIEADVERGLAAFRRVGLALAEIRDSRLYRATHSTFEAYLDDRWHMARSRGYQFIEAASVSTTVDTAGLPAPANERQARELARLGDDAEIIEVWHDLCEQYGAGVTADLIRQLVERRMTRELLAEQPAPEPVATPPFPDRRYPCLVIDPPWPVATIARTHRPNQGRHLPYPTMTLDQIAALPVPDLADKGGCHVYLWTTHRFLPDALDLFARWNVRYECLLTWVKPPGWPRFDRWQFNSEHVLFGVAAPLPLLTSPILVAFSAPNGGHSVKPDKFYDLVRLASPGPRLDMFARGRHEGFDAWGNEVAA